MFQDSSSSLVSVESDEEPVSKIRKLCDSPTQPPDENLDVSRISNELEWYFESLFIWENNVCW